MADRVELERILNTDIPHIEGKNIWIWGTGDTAQLYQEGFKRLESEGFSIKGYIDNDTSKVGGMFNEKPVISPEKVKQIDNIYVLLCSIRPGVIKEVTAQLNALQVEWHFVDEVVLKLHGDLVMKVYDMLSDGDSKETFVNLIKWRITGKKTEMKILEEDYFALTPFMKDKPDEVFVDCGAWRGDTVERYTEHRKGIFKKIIAFEPDKISFAALEDTADGLRNKYGLKEEAFVLCPFGVGETTKEVFFERYENNNGLGSKYKLSVAREKGNSKIVSLDEYLSEPYSFLKADIESFEYQMLCGAKRSIKKYKPLLAICIYHNVVDLYSIPLLIKEYVSEYKIAVRHHADDLSGTVVYAWI